MTTEAATDLSQGRSDSVQPSTDLNDPANWDFEDDSDESQNNVPEPKTGTDPKRETDESEPDATQEADDEQESTSQDDSDDTTEDATAPVEVNVPDDAMVTLANGEKVKFADLKESPMLKAHFTRTMQELGNQRRSVGEQATRITGIVDAFTDYLSQQIPDEPSYELAFTDANEYTRQKVIRDAALARVQGLIELGTKAKAESRQLEDAELQTARAEAAQKVADQLPFLRDPVKARQFDKDIAETAARIGYSQEDLSRMTDPRLFLLAHYATEGLRAEAAKQKVQQKVQAAPQVTPAKKAQQKGNPDFIRNKEAMRRLAKSGSIHDAMAIDFDD